MNIKFSKNETKGKLQEKLIPAITSKGSFVRPQCLNPTKKNVTVQMSCAVNDDDAVDDDNICNQCKTLYIDCELWIMCDLCEKWYHRECTDIANDDEWEALQGGDDFKCLKC
jgi:hypothetical protein